jgi:hypothetical protein
MSLIQRSLFHLGFGSKLLLANQPLQTDRGGRFAYPGC